MNTVDAIAKKEYADAIRSRALIAAALAFFLLTLLLTGVYLWIGIRFDGGNGEATVQEMVNFITTGATVIVPVLAILLSYKAIAGERTKGSLSVMLSLPNTRLDVFLGKFVGRSLILLTAIAASLIAGLMVSLWSFGAAGALVFFQYVLFISLLGIIYIALGLAMSGATGSSTLAAAGSLTLFALFRFIWTPFVFVTLAVVARVRTGSWSGGEDAVPETLFHALTMLNPHNAYGVIVDQLIYDSPSGIARSEVIESGSMLGSPAVGSLVLLAWIVVPLALGYARFNSIDL